MTKNNISYYDLFFRELYQPMFLTEPPRFLYSIYNTDSIVSRYRLLRYYDKLCNESGNTLFLIKIGTFENLTKSLQKNGVIKVVNPDHYWSTEAFEGFHSRKISDLIQLMYPEPPTAIRVPISSLYIGRRTYAMYNTWFYYRLPVIKQLEHEIIETVIPNFKLNCQYKPEPIKLPPMNKRQGGIFKCGHQKKYNLI